MGTEPVYNMEVDGTHCFAVNGGIVVHNCDALRYLVATERVIKALESPGDEYRGVFGR